MVRTGTLVALVASIIIAATVAGFWAVNTVSSATHAHAASLRSVDR